MNLGDFEHRVLSELRRVGPSTPTQLLKTLEHSVAYTTLTTTLYRLKRKGLVDTREIENRKRLFYIDERGDAFRKYSRNLWEKLLSSFGPGSVAYLLENGDELSEEEIDALLTEIERVRRGES